MKWRLVLAFVPVAAFVAAAVSPARGAHAGTQSALTKTCHKGYTHATFSWGERCVRVGQYCKKVRNPEYHRYQFQCVNGKLKRLPPGNKKGK